MLLNELLLFVFRKCYFVYTVITGYNKQRPQLNISVPVDACLINGGASTNRRQLQKKDASIDFLEGGLLSSHIN